MKYVPLLLPILLITNLNAGIGASRPCTMLSLMAEIFKVQTGENDQPIYTLLASCSRVMRSNKYWSEPETSPNPDNPLYNISLGVPSMTDHIERYVNVKYSSTIGSMATIDQPVMLNFNGGKHISEGDFLTVLTLLEQEEVEHE